MKINKILIISISILLLIGNQYLAQEIFVKVIRGKAKVNSIRKYPNNPPTKLNIKDTVFVLKALVLVSKGDKETELQPDKNYLYKEISGLIAKTKPKNTNAYFDVLTSADLQTYKKRSGGSARGSSDLPGDYQFPNDDILILSDTVELIIGNDATKLESKVVVYNSLTSDTILHAQQGKKKIKLYGLHPGKHIWTYSIGYPKGDKYITDKHFKNRFVVPSIADKKEALKKIKAFKKEIRGYSEGMQKALIKDYLGVNNFYLNHIN
tara:strand:+ start:1433 stop:2227 length:795 start_codon:yes stop_codon:yes gene_type:complete